MNSCSRQNTKIIFFLSSGLALDAQAGLDYLSQRTDIDPTRIVVFGRSLGGGVAASLLQNRSYSSRISAVMLENTFTDLPSIAKKIFDFRVIHMLPHFCYKNKVRILIMVNFWNLHNSEH